MDRSIITNIEIAIPDKTIELGHLLKILRTCSNIRVLDKTLIQATSDYNLKPTTTFVVKQTKDPSFSFTGSGLKNECFYVGKLPISFGPSKPKVNLQNTRGPIVITKSDNIGKYLQVKWPFATYNQLNFEQLYSRVADKVTSFDHVGIHINPRLLPKSRYVKMKKIIARSSYLSKHPTGKEWPFIIPTSLIERRQKIKIGIKRDPKFEFVYDFNYFYPEIQLDIQTNLSPKKTLALFPSPYGYYDSNPRTGDYCSSVFIHTGWASVSLRIDLRFYVPNFSSADWLLCKGSRIT